MPESPLSIETEAQQVLDELWNEGLIPFPLRIGKVIKVSDGYSLHFHDSRMRTAHVPSDRDDSLKDAVRAAVLERVAKLSGPLKNWPKT